MTRTLEDEIESFREMKERGDFAHLGADDWVVVSGGRLFYIAKEFAEAIAWVDGQGLLNKVPVLIRQIEERPLMLPLIAVDRDRSLENVREFHRVFGCHIADRPRIPPLGTAGWPDVNTTALHLLDIAEGLKRKAALHKEGLNEGAALVLIRLQLMVEEIGELAHAIANGDLVEALDALADIDYVVNGTWLTLGLDGLKAEACQIVHDSNMSKLDADGRPIISEAGRVVKGPGYWPPTERLRELLRR